MSGSCGSTPHTKGLKSVAGILEINVSAETISEVNVIKRRLNMKKKSVTQLVSTIENFSRVSERRNIMVKLGISNLKKLLIPVMILLLLGAGGRVPPSA